MEYLPTFARTKSPSHVGKYTSTTEHMDMEGIKVFESHLSYEHKTTRLEGPVLPSQITYS